MPEPEARRGSAARPFARQGQGEGRTRHARPGAGCAVDACNPGSSAAATPPPLAATPSPANSAAIQQSIARIQDACQAPPLAPHEYRLLFEVMAKEISDNDLIGAQTLANITQRAQDRGLGVRRDDVRFVLEVVSEADPWFEQGASANLFAGRFRNFVVARCRGQGLNLSADELDLIDAWFAGGTLPQPLMAAGSPAAPPPPAQAPPPPPLAQPLRAAAPAPAPSGRGPLVVLDDGRAQQPAEPARPAPHRRRRARRRRGLPPHRADAAAQLARLHLPG